MTSASGGLQRPRIFNEVVQPRGRNINFAKSNFMHSHKISAKSDNGNTSKQTLENQRLLEAKMEVKVHASINFSTDYENSSVF